jgi:rubrerythrin
LLAPDEFGTEEAGKEFWMAIRFNAQEIFEIGVKIEENGRAFYQAAAEASESEEATKLFEELADWEGQHIALFQNLKDKLPAGSDEQTAFDPYHEQSLYLRAAADSHVFGRDADPGQMARDCASPVDALRKALGFEKDSVVVYTSMRNMVPEKLGKGEIDKLVNEELSHIRIISEKIAELV